jgi:glutathione synthase/RimK-type ligase-like ATP-grasp enzyme
VSRVFLATCADLPEGDEDEDAPQLVAACARAGLDVQWAVWDDPAVDWSEADLVVIRTTWDYTQRREEFLAWAAGLARVANPLPVLEWNSDKTYLRELATAGVPVVATQWAGPGDDVDLPSGTDFVIKPAVGAGSMGAGRFAADDPDTPQAARRHIRSLHDLGRTVMVQPYLHEVDEFGETALVFIGGAYSHAIRKASMLPKPVVYRVGEGASRELFVSERIVAREPGPAERALAEQVLANVPGPPELLYARVDLLPSPDGPVLIELELTEPSLFLRHRPGAADRLARAISRRVRTPARRPAGSA